MYLQNLLETTDSECRNLGECILRWLAPNFGGAMNRGNRSSIAEGAIERDMSILEEVGSTASGACSFCMHSMDSIRW